MIKKFFWLSGVYVRDPDMSALHSFPDSLLTCRINIMGFFFFFSSLFVCVNVPRHYLLMWCSNTVPVPMSWCFPGTVNETNDDELQAFSKLYYATITTPSLPAYDPVASNRPILDRNIYLVASLTRHVAYYKPTDSIGLFCVYRTFLFLGQLI